MQAVQVVHTYSTPMEILGYSSPLDLEAGALVDEIHGTYGVLICTYRQGPLPKLYDHDDLVLFYAYVHQPAACRKSKIFDVVQWPAPG